MRKFQVLSVIAALFIFGFAVSAQAQDWKIGAGCEGMYAGPLVQGISVRAWTGPIGLEGNLFTGNAKIKVDTGSDSTTIKGKVNAIGLKGMYAPIVKTNSKFYCGGQVNYAALDADIADGGGDGTAWTYGLFMGSEFSWQELPEIGINLEVGYMLNSADIDVDDTDVSAELDINGVNVALGVHYYF